MPIRISSLTPADIPAMVTVSDLAFAHDAFHQSIMPPHMTPAQYDEYRAWRASLIQLRMNKPGSRYFKAVDGETGELVGVSGFHAPELEGTDGGARWPGRPEWLVGADSHAEMFKKMREKVLGARKDLWFLQTMSVLPAYQGRGIGRMLMHAGLEVVDEEGKECYVEATMVAEKVYVKAGFEVKDTELLFDGTYRMTALLRPAAKRKDID